MSTYFRDLLLDAKRLVNLRLTEICREQEFPDHVVPLLLRGKRLRSGLLFAVHDACCDTGEENVVDLACAIELAHASSLIFDDILDEDTQRRGTKTLHVQIGTKTAILDSLGILSVPYEIAAAYGTEYVKTLSRTQRGMVSGTLKELLHNPDLPALNLYKAIITQKTGLLFGLAARWGYMSALREDTTPEDTQKWEEFGVSVGNVMQIADDIADLRKVMQGKKTRGFGSEMLLLKAVTVDSLLKEFFRDIKRLKPRLWKAKLLYRSEGIERSLTGLLERESQNTNALLNEMQCTEYQMYSITSDIARAMLEETDGRP
jgi:geranylgeranyl diphosphate synthase type II